MINNKEAIKLLKKNNLFQILQTKDNLNNFDVLLIFNELILFNLNECKSYHKKLTQENKQLINDGQFNKIDIPNLAFNDGKIVILQALIEKIGIMQDSKK